MSEGRQYERIDKDLEGSWGFEVTRAGYSHVGPHMSSKMVIHGNFPWKGEYNGALKGHKLPHHFLLYIPTGAGVFETRTHSYEVTAGDLYFLRRDIWGRHIALEETGREIYWVGFAGRYIDEYICDQLFARQTEFVRRVGYRPDLIALFEQVLSYASDGSQRSQLLSLGCLIQILAFAVGIPVQNGNTSSPGIADFAIDYIRRNMFSEIDFEDLARTYSLSYGRFRALFREVTGLSPYQFLLNERLACAQRLLKDPTISIKSAAFKSGFNSQANFSKIFRRKTGTAPIEVRARR